MRLPSQFSFKNLSRGLVGSVKSKIAGNVAQAAAETEAVKTAATDYAKAEAGKQWIKFAPAIVAVIVVLALLAFSRR